MDELLKTNLKNDLEGKISVQLNGKMSLDEYCRQNIENYNPDRFELLAIRLYFGTEQIVTVYAIDKDRMEGNNFNQDKMPVKKFKLDFTFLQNLLPIVDNLNFTLTTGNYPIEDMEVYNK